MHPPYNDPVVAVRGISIRLPLLNITHKVRELWLPFGKTLKFHLAFASSTKQSARLKWPERKTSDWLPHSVLVQPVPHGSGLDRELLGTALESALKRARLEQVTGKPLTPFLLDAIRQATFGRGLVANRALLVANARLAAKVAAVLVHGRGGTGGEATAGLLD